MEQALNMPSTPETPEARKMRKNALSAALALFLALLLAYLGLCAYAGGRNTFYPNMSINGTAVGGLTAAQAQALLAETLPSRILTLADCESGEAVLTVPLSGLGYTAEGFAPLAQTYIKQQAEGGFFLQGWRFLIRLAGHTLAVQDWPPPEPAAFDAAADRLAGQLSLPPIHGAFALEQNGIAVTCPRSGRSIDRAALECLRDPTLWQETFRAELSFSSIPAKALTAQEIAAALCGEAQNAGYDAAADAITPERIGVTFDVAAAQQAMDAAAPGATIQLPARIEHPAVTAEALRQLLFRDVLGECRTTVSGTAARKNNVRLAAAAINGVVLNCGESFSFNETVGQRTAARGYQAAPAYVSGETVDEIGGGICQVSSTLYLACLRSNLQITERYAHRYTPSYIPWGMDATVSWGGPDYQFTNNTDYPVKITASYKDGSLTVRLLGTNLSGVTAKITSETSSKTPWKTVYEESTALAPGAEQVKTTPYTGYTVKTYRSLYAADGRWLSTAYEATSSYKARDQVILRGAETQKTPTGATVELPAEPGPPLPNTPDVPAAGTVPLPDGEAPSPSPTPSAPGIPANPAAPSEPAEPADPSPDTEALLPQAMP